AHGLGCLAHRFDRTHEGGEAVLELAQLLGRRFDPALHGARDVHGQATQRDEDRQHHDARADRLREAQPGERVHRRRQQQGERDRHHDGQQQRRREIKDDGDRDQHQDPQSEPHGGGGVEGSGEQRSDALGLRSCCLARGGFVRGCKSARGHFALSECRWLCPRCRSESHAQRCRAMDVPGVGTAVAIGAAAIQAPSLRIATCIQRNREELSMKLRSALTTAAVSLALAGLAGCGDEPDTTTSQAPETTTAPPPATTTTPPADTTTSAPPASGSTATAPSTTGDADRTAGQTVDDAAVTAKVKAALMAESGVDGTNINVDTVNGTVTLKGKVADKGMIDRAVQVAKGVEGVKDVVAQLSTGAG